MSFQDFLNTAPDVYNDFFVPDMEKIELLQAILGQQYQREVTFEEAQEVGMQLISFYECLAHERTILPGGEDGDG